MERKEFIEKFQNCKRNAHRFLVKNRNGFSIERGPRVISSYFEDLFAVYVAEKINDKNYNYYVDKSFSYQNDKAKTCKPDVLVSNLESKGVAYFDVKTDLGSHKSSFGKFIKEKNEFIKSVKGRTITTKIESANENQKNITVDVELAQNIKYYIVVGGRWAHTIKNQTEYEHLLKECPNVKLSILVDWTKKKNDNFVEQSEDFDQLDGFLENIAKNSSSAQTP